jgi:uncharacterized membrane protein
MINKKSIIDAFQRLNHNGSILRTIIYTIGHMCIAIVCLMSIAKVPFSIALTDAIVEPLINGVWYYVLDRYWASRVANKVIEDGPEHIKYHKEIR